MTRSLSILSAFHSSFKTWWCPSKRLEDKSARSCDKWGRQTYECDAARVFWPCTKSSSISRLIFLHLLPYSGPEKMTLTPSVEHMQTAVGTLLQSSAVHNYLSLKQTSSICTTFMAKDATMLLFFKYALKLIYLSTTLKSDQICARVTSLKTCFSHCFYCATANSCTINELSKNHKQLTK